MPELPIEDVEGEPKTVRSLKTSLRRTFKPTRDNDLMKVLELATYLFCLGEHDQCVELLDWVLGFEADRDRDREDLWSSFGMATMLRAHLHHLAGSEAARLDLIKIVYDDDVYTADRSRKQTIERMHANHEHFLTILDQTGRRDRQRSFSYSFIEYLYAHEMTRLDPGDTTKEDRRRVADMLGTVKEQVASALLS